MIVLVRVVFKKVVWGSLDNQSPYDKTDQSKPRPEASIPLFDEDSSLDSENVETSVINNSLSKEYSYLDEHTRQTRVDNQHILNTKPFRID